METIYRTCSICKGVNHTPEYKLKASNFFNLRVDLTKNNDLNAPAIPMPIGPNEGVNKYYSNTVCKECVEQAGGSVAAIVAIMETAKANDAEIKAALNA